MGASNGPRIITNGLTLHLDSAEYRSYSGNGTIWNDLTSAKNIATFYNSPTFTTFGGNPTFYMNNPNKYTYSGTPHGFLLSNNPGIPSAASFTFEAWFYQLSAGVGQIVLLSNASGCDGYRWGPYNNSAYYLYGDAACEQFSEGYVGSFTSMIGRWVQMVGVFDRSNTLGGGVKFYNWINGIAQGNVSLFSPTIQLGAPGISAVYCCGAFDGYLSIIRVYNRALTESEINQNFNAHRRRFKI